MKKKKLKKQIKKLKETVEQQELLIYSQEKLIEALRNNPFNYPPSINVPFVQTEDQ